MVHLVLKVKSVDKFPVQRFYNFFQKTKNFFKLFLRLTFILANFYREKVFSVVIFYRSIKAYLKLNNFQFLWIVFCKLYLKKDYLFGDSFTIRCLWILKFRNVCIWFFFSWRGWLTLTKSTWSKCYSKNILNTSSQFSDLLLFQAFLKGQNITFDFDHFGKCTFGICTYGVKTQRCVCVEGGGGAAEVLWN